MRKLIISLNKKYSLYTLALILLSFACTEEKGLVELRKADGELTGKEIPISTFIYNPRDIAIMENRLVVFDRIDNNMFKLFSFPDLKYLFSWGKKGEGPDEIGFVHTSGLLARDHTFSFVDKNVFKTYKISPLNNLNLVEKIHLIDSQGPLNGINRLNDSLFIAIFVDQLNPKEEYVFLYPEKKRGGTFGELPEEGLEFEHYRQKVMYYHKVNVVNRNKKRIMDFYIRLNLIKIYDFEGKLLDEIEFNEYSPSGFNPKWSTFGHADATDNYVYVLYTINNQNSLESEENKPFPKDLLILNWEGEVIKRYHMKTPIANFAVSENLKKIYGLPIMGGDKLLEFDLPEI